ncbi:putative motility protein [Candidatus Methylospira mobilis]|uniref:Putative motility protein n=1 Tax=Candidatus Methylospira mobilis TaxID=1808979 RepID=A0A5Q0BHE8_9GAMM|nr:YjfB family protein [Candidatus Methylospira mobilis]QFY41558.1 putative motility protein [Candidatus Methylospira mobilis]WNV05201.1 YjfB family protein [Candidatus Methylospira mobilis]
MSVNGVPSLSANLSTAAANPHQNIGVAMFKKALDNDASTTQSLISAATSAPSATNLPPNLGQNVNITA